MSINHVNKSNEWVTSPSQSLLSKRDRDIYMMGKEKGEQEVFEKFQKAFNENLSKSYADTSKILDKIKTEKLEIISARLKVLHPNSLKVAISVKESENLSEKLSLIYDFIYDLEEKQNTDNYNVDYSIIKANSTFNEKNIENDGYIYKHLLFLNEKRARKS
jgi:hypothetical protein